jgi:PAS domain S-box-containing protein
MKLTIGSRLVGSFAVIVLIACVSAFVVYRYSQKLISADQWVEHTQIVLSQLVQVRTSMRKMNEASYWAILSGDTSAVQRYINDENKTDIILDQLVELTSDNPVQRPRLLAIRNLIHQYVTAAAVTLKGKDVGAKNSNMRVEYSLSQAVFAQLDATAAEENRLLVIRNQTMESGARETIMLLLFFSCGVLVLVCFSAYTIFSYLKERQEKEKLEKQQADAVLEGKIRLDATLATMAEGLAHVDSNGNLIYLNAAGERFLGYKVEDLRGRNMHDCVHWRDADGNPRSRDDCSVHAAVKSGEPVNNHDDVFVCADNSLLPVSVCSAPYIVDGVITGAVVTFRDITGQKQLEAERKLAQTRVSEFYSTVSHELRTPLTSIRGALGLIAGGKAGVLSDKANQLVQIARSECDRLIRLINEILELRKIEAGKLEFNLEPLSCRALVNDTILSIKNLSDTANIEIDSDFSQDEQTIFSDRDRFMQVLTNLLGNAIKFSPAGGKISVSVSRGASGMVRFAVKDNGSGIAADQLPKLFGKFQQLDSSDSRPKGGTGLGLAISKGIVEELGGQIGVESVVNQGSTFWFELPDVAYEEVPADGGREGAFTALVIEDDNQLVKVLQTLLTSSGFGFRGARTLSDAKKHLARQIPSVIILDITLPDGNGLEFLQWLRASSQTQDVPVIILTGHQPDANVVGGPFLVDWITKPFDESRLKKALRLAIRGSKDSRAKALVVEDDLPTRELIAHTLEALGITCLEATDGVEAIHTVRKEDPDLIVLDVGIPSPDGFEVVRILRNEKAHQTPLLIYTCRDLLAADKQALTLGLTRHLVKSKTSEEEFLAAVKELLDGLIIEKEESTI